MPRRRNDIVISAIADVQQALRELEQLQDEMDGIKNGGQKADKGLSTLTKGVAGFVSVAALIEGARIANNLAKIGAEATDVANAFNKLDNSSQLLSNLRNNVRGAVPDVELMRTALSGIDLGGTNEQLETFAKFARLESVRKGSNTLEVFNNILGGVFRGSTELLDNFGFSLAQVNGEIENQARALGKNANALSAVERRNLLASAVVKLMNERLAASGEIATTNAEKIRANAAAVENLKVRIGQFLSESGDAFINFFAEAAAGANTFLDSLGVGGGSRIQQLTEEFVTSRNAINKQTDSLQKMVDRYKELKSIASPTLEQQDELKGIVKQLSGAVDGVSTEFGDYGEALDVNLGLVEDFIKGQRELLKLREADRIFDIKDTVEKSTKAIQRLNLETDIRQKKIKELKDSGKSETFGPVGGANTQTLSNAQAIAKYRAEVSELEDQAAEAGKALNSMAFAANTLFDLTTSTPETLSAELDISEELAGKLINRFKELEATRKKATKTTSGSNATKNLDDQIKKQLEASKLKQRLDEIELNGELSKYDKMREAVTARYEAEINTARTKSAALADLKQKELDNQLALINQQEQAEIDAATDALRQKLALDGIELDTSLGKYEREKAALRERYAVEIAEARKVSAELASLKEQELVNALKKVDLKRLNDSLKAQFQLEIDLGDTEADVLASFQRMMAALNQFYSEQLALAAGNADQLKIIEAAKTEDIAQLNQALADHLADIYVQDMINRNGILSGLEASYDTFAANLLDTEKTGAEKRMEIFMSFYDALKNAIFDALKARILASLKETAVFQSQKTTEMAIETAAAGQKTAHDSAEIARSGAKAAANTSEAASGFIAAHSKIPFVGLALALGFIATMMSTLKGIKGKAQGGRVRRDDLTPSPFTPKGDDGLAGLQVGEDVMTVGEVARYGHILDAIHAGKPLPMVQAAFQAAVPGPLTPPPIAPGVFMPGGAAGAGIIQQVHTVQQVPVRVKTELELIQADGASVRAHHIEVEDKILEPHRNQKNRQRRSSTEGLF